MGEVSAKVGFYSKEKLVLDLGNLKSKVRVNKEHALPVIQVFFYCSALKMTKKYSNLFLSY